jgi:protein tyrosine phosphatase
MINIDNSLKLYEILESSNINPNQCPPEVTYQMLEKELMCADLENADPKYSIDELWKIYYYNHKSSDNIFGFTSLPNISQPLETIAESPIEEPIGTSLEQSIEKRLSQISRRKSTLRQPSTGKNAKKYNISINNNNKGNRNTTTRKTHRNSVRGSVKSSVRGSVTRRLSKNPYLHTRGGGNLYDANKASYCKKLNSSIPSKKKWYGSKRQPIEKLIDFRPHWPILMGNNNTRQHTVTKLKPVNGTNLYVYGTSLPMNSNITYNDPNMTVFQYVNNLLFYRYVKGVSRLIDLHGCNMNWDLITINGNVSWTPFKPRDCDGLNEKRIWRRITRSDIYENNVKKDDDVYSRYSSFYWLDMTAGYFNTYHDIMKLSFDDPKLKSIVHCKAGFGRTGTVLLLIICKYYFNTPDKIREFQRIFDFNISRANRKEYALRAIHKLYDLLESHIEIDLIDKRKEPCLRTELVEAINSETALFDTNWILYELFRGFYDVGIGFRRDPKYVLDSTRPNLPVIDLSLTELNVLITRINYILYFVASYHNIGSVNLYELYSPYGLRRTLQQDRYINDNVLAIPLLQPVNVMVAPFTENVSEMYTDLQRSRNFTTTGLRLPNYKTQQPNAGNMSATERATQERIRATLEQRRIENERRAALQAIEAEEREALERERRLSRQPALDQNALSNRPTTPATNPHDIIEKARGFTKTKADKFRTQPPQRNPSLRTPVNRITEEDTKDLTDVSI